MARITVKHTKVGGLEKRITNLKKFLEKDLVKDVYNKAEDKLQMKWRSEIPLIFNVRSSLGLRCDNILSKSLAIEQRANNIIVYVEPIVRYSKNSTSSGGAVRNLTTILFRGSRPSYGKYYLPWDARTQSGIHPGTSPSTMRNYWKQFTKYAKAEIRKAINNGMKKTMRKK